MNTHETSAPLTAIVDWALRLPPGVDLSQWRLGFERSMPAWGWLLLGGAIVAAAWWSLRGVRLPVWRGVAAGTLRALLLALLAVLIAGPLLTFPRERVEPDWVVVLCDRSRSMEIADAAIDGAPASRDRQLESALERHRETWTGLAASRRVMYLGFDAGLRELEVGADALPRLGDADGIATEIGPALSRALERVAARPVSGFVLLSDGRTTAPPDRSLLRRFQGEGVRIHVVPLGASEASGDHAIRAVDAPQRVFASDEVPIEVEIDRSATVGGALRVKLVDDATGRVLDAREFTDDATGRRTVTLVGRADAPGERAWRVEIEPDGRDLVAENNVRNVRLDVIDRPIRVLYIEGYPRWEYRYLKNLLVREHGIESSVMLLSADRDFAQEGNAPIARLPRNAQEFAAYDLVILGDVAAGAFSEAQMNAIRELVATRGAGLLWIGGDRAVPRTWKGTPLEETIPFRGALEPERFDDSVTMRPTPRASRLGLLRIAEHGDEPWPEELTRRSAGWSRLEWAQRFEPADLKPTAEVIAETASGDDGQPLPLLVAMRYGAGQSMYMATDETWRWRYGRGETLPERFWLQLLRHLARSSVDAHDRAVQLLVEPRRVESGDPVRIEVTRFDPDELSPGGAAGRVKVEIAPTEGGAATEAVTVELAPIEDVPGRYAATIFPDRPGTYRVTAAAGGGTGTNEIGGADAAPGTELEVVRSDLELARPETDHALLAQIAEATNGEVLTIADLELLSGPDLLPNRALSVEQPLTRTLWDTPLALLLLILIPALEWSVRRWSRLA